MRFPLQHFEILPCLYPNCLSTSLIDGNSATISFDKCQITSGTFTFGSEGKFEGIVVSVDKDGKITATKQ